MSSPFNSLVRITASAMLALVLAGCIVTKALAGYIVTKESLDLVAAQKPIKTGVVKSTEATLNNPLPAEKLYGRWVGGYENQTILWKHDGGYKRFACRDFRFVLEFTPDSKFSFKCWEKGKLITDHNDKWEYKINKYNIAEIILHGLKLPYRSVFWVNENEIVLAEFRNGDIAAQYRLDDYTKYQYPKETWTSWCNYTRDKYLNELWVSYHISTNQLTGDRRELHASANILRRTEDVSVVVSQKPNGTSSSLSASSTVRGRLEELMSIAKFAPLKVPEEELPTRKEIEVKPFHREYLVGKWYSRTKTYQKEWSAYKDAPIKVKETTTEHETIYEFMDNGSFIKTHRFVIHDETSPNNGKWQVTKDSGSWNYSESEGDIVLIVDKASSSFKQSMGQAHINKTSIIWFSENNMVIRSRKDKTTKGNFKSDKRKYESSWFLDEYGCMHSTFRFDNKDYYKYQVSISLPFHLTRISVSPSDDPKTLYRIVSIEREPKNIFGYHFVLELTSAGKRSSSVIQQVLREFRSMIKREYMETYSVFDSQSLVVDFPEYAIKDGRIEGRGVVIAMSVVSLNYNPNTRQGRLGIRVSPNQFEMARKYARKNIETLARDKNIALTTGEIPPAAKFYLGREELKDGNVLEIEFRTE